jgi:hypothetical protein
MPSPQHSEPIAIEQMNETLKQIRARAENAYQKRMTEEQRRAQRERRKGEAAAPLFEAFKDVRNQLVKVSVLQRIWPEDYHERNDRALVLVAELIGDRRRPHGIKLHVPGGYRRFAVEILDDESLSYLASREVLGGRPHVVSYEDREQWLDAFYSTMASLLEL